MAEASTSHLAVTTTVTEERQTSPVLRLKLRKPKNDKQVKWTSDTVDNEHMNKKKSKCCCIYEKPKMFGESSSEDEDDDCKSCRGHKKKCYKGNDEENHDHGGPGPSDRGSEHASTIGNGSTACRRSITRLRPRPLMPIKLKRRPPAPLVKVTVEPLIKVSNLSDQPQKFNVYEPDMEDTLENRALEHEDYFQVRQTVKLTELFDAGVHYGHKDGCRNVFMKPYLFGCRLGVDIFDLDKTVSLLQDALNFLGHIVYRGGIILFVSRNKQNMFVVEKAARDAGEYSHCRYWKGGLITNSTALYGGLTRLPDLCIFINCQNNVFEEHLAITECARMMIPTIGIVDSDCDPRLISYPVPGNDDSPSAVQLYCQLFRDTILCAKEYKERDLALHESENETDTVQQESDQKVEVV